GDQASMLDTLLDPSRSGLANSSRILLQIEGEGIGYLRCFSLVDTDGVRWTAAQRPPLKRIEYIPRERLNAYLHRRVQVKNVAFLARMLPADGSVVQITGKFFNRAFQNAHGGIEADSMWNASRNVYEYWIQTNAPPERIFLAQFRRYTNYPPQSARLQTWLDQSLEGIPDPLAQARHLEKIFHSQFTYRLGAPQLDRLNAIDQFILNEREGHCERFAASLALLLRMKGIPSRVVIGYVPGTRNRFTGAWNVRFKDAHSWTEAYFPNHGWVQFDATPPASRSPEDEKWSLREFIEDLDFAWSSYIVNFDASGQSQLLSATVQGLSQSARWIRQHLIWTLPVVALIGLAFLCKHWPKWRWAVLRRKTARPVSHYYGEMLQLLDEFGLTKLDQQTPFEFLAETQQRGFALRHDVDLVTRFFCAHRYGRQPLTDSETSQIEDALRRLQAFRGGQNASA
ncbi:MAG: transglutaminase domain-containing protein, partial [Verrucomicrobiota bacterium]